MTSARTGSLAAVGSVLALGAAAPDLARAAGPALLAVGVVVGVPHGALDHLVPSWLDRQQDRPTAERLRRVAATVLLYLAAVGGTLAAYVAAPVAITAGLLLLSVVHFGLGDLGYDREAGVRRGTVAGTLAVVAAGGVPVVLPISLHAGRTDSVLSQLAPALPALLSPAVRIALLAVVLVAAAATAAHALVQRRPVGALEVAAVVALFAVVPPLTAFGVWFGGWHSVRHLARLLHHVPGSTTAERRRTAVRAAALPTAGGLALLGALAAGRAPVGASLLGLLALTVPHAVVVAQLDRRAGAQPVGAVERSARLRPRNSTSTSLPRRTVTS